MDEYILWSATLGGWFSTSAHYTTQFEKAAIFTRAEAFDIAKRHLTNNDLGVIPVVRADIQEVRGDIG